MGALGLRRPGSRGKAYAACAPTVWIMIVSHFLLGVNGSFSPGPEEAIYSALNCSQSCEGNPPPSSCLNPDTHASARDHRSLFPFWGPVTSALCLAPAEHGHCVFLWTRRGAVPDGQLGGERHRPPGHGEGRIAFPLRQGARCDGDAYRKRHKITPPPGPISFHTLSRCNENGPKIEGRAFGQLSFDVDDISFQRRPFRDWASRRI